MSTNPFGLQRPVYPLREAMNIAGTKRTQTYKLAKLGHLRLSKIGRKTVVFADDLTAFLIAIKEGGVK